MKFTLSVFVTLAVAVGIAVAADAGPSNVKDAFDSAGVSLLFFWMCHMLTPMNVDTKGAKPH